MRNEESDVDKFLLRYFDSRASIIRIFVLKTDWFTFLKFRSFGCGQNIRQFRHFVALELGLKFYCILINFILNHYVTPSISLIFISFVLEPWALHYCFHINLTSNHFTLQFAMKTDNQSIDNHGKIAILHSKYSQEI